MPRVRVRTNQRGKVDQQVYERAFSDVQRRDSIRRTSEVRKFAYELAENIGLKTPCSWEKNQMAGKDWLSSFLKRNKTPSIRRPQATSMSRSTSFNKTKKAAFFKNR